MADSRNEQRALLGHAYLLWTSHRRWQRAGAHRRSRPCRCWSRPGTRPGWCGRGLWRGFAHQSRSQYAEAVSALERARHHSSGAPAAWPRSEVVFGNLSLSLWLSATPCDQAIARCRALIEQERGRHSTAEAHVAIAAGDAPGRKRSRAPPPTRCCPPPASCSDRTPRPVSVRDRPLHRGRAPNGGRPDCGRGQPSLRHRPCTGAPRHAQPDRYRGGLATVLCESGRFAEALDLAERSRLHAAPGDVGTQIGWRQALARASAGAGQHRRRGRAGRTGRGAGGRYGLPDPAGRRAAGPGRGAGPGGAAAEVTSRRLGARCSATSRRASRPGRSGPRRCWPERRPSPRPRGRPGRGRGSQ